jgi:hypothetical protein
MLARLFLSQAEYRGPIPRFNRWNLQKWIGRVLFWFIEIRLDGTKPSLRRRIIQMNRIFLIMVLWAFVSALFVPALAAGTPHHGDAALPHAAEQDDCGCVCHAEMQAVLTSDPIEVHLVTFSADCLDNHLLPDACPPSLDRPPELFS